MSAYRVEVQRGREVWALADVVRARDEVCAMRQVLIEAKNITAIRARREYPGLLTKGEGYHKSCTKCAMWMATKIVERPCPFFEDKLDALLHCREIHDVNKSTA